MWIQIKGQRRRATGAPPKKPRLHGALAKDVIDGRSKALIGDSVWIVECEDGLKKGDKVKITGVENGVILKAEKA